MSDSDIALVDNKSKIEEQRKKVEDNLTKLSTKMTRLRRINRNWDASLTIATILLTLTITIATSLTQINEDDKKIITGILGGIIVAIQSISNAFPVKQRAGSYRLLQAQANNLLNDVKYIEGI